MVIKPENSRLEQASLTCFASPTHPEGSTPNFAAKYQWDDRVKKMWKWKTYELDAKKNFWEILRFLTLFATGIHLDQDLQRLPSHVSNHTVKHIRNLQKQKRNKRKPITLTSTEKDSTNIWHHSTDSTIHSNFFSSLSTVIVTQRSWILYIPFNTSKEGYNSYQLINSSPTIHKKKRIITFSSSTLSTITRLGTPADQTSKQLRTEHSKDITNEPTTNTYLAKASLCCSASSQWNATLYLQEATNFQIAKQYKKIRPFFQSKIQTFKN